MKLLKSGFIISLIALALFVFIGCQPPASSATAALTTGGNSSTTNNSDTTGQQPAQQQPGQQPQPTQAPTSTPVAQTTVSVGGSTEINGASGAVQATFTVEQPQFINILAQSVDGKTNPRIFLYNAKDRLLTYSDDYTANRDDLNDFDSFIEDTFLIPGSYSVRVETAGGDGSIRLSVATGTGGVLGLGQLTTIHKELAPGERFLQPITLKAGELVSITAISESDSFDPRLSLRGAGGVQVAKNDDTDSFDALLDVTDAKIENFIAPEDSTYRIELRGFSAKDTGSVQLLIFRYGTLEPVESQPQIMTGKIMQRQRISMPLELQAGEVVSVAARALNSQVDPQIALLDPNNIIVISNDDHSTKNPALDRYDAEFTGYVTQVGGTYTLDLESVGGRGTYELTITRAGKLNPSVIGEPVDVNAGTVATPAPSPESTAEVTPGS